MNAAKPDHRHKHTSWRLWRKDRIYIDIKKEKGQDRSLGHAISQTSKPALLAITGGKGEASILDKLQDHPNHVLIRQRSYQDAGN